MEGRKGVSVQPAQPVEPGEPGVPGASMAGYWRCREEQQPWYADMPSQVAIGALPEEGRTWRFFSALGAALLLLWAPRRWLAACGNLNGARAAVAAVAALRHGGNLAALLLAFHLALQTSSLHYRIVGAVRGAPASAAADVMLLTAAVLFLKPLLIYQAPQSLPGGAPPPSANRVHHIHHRLLQEPAKNNSPAVPVAYGLATALSAPCVGLLTVGFLLAALVSLDGYASALVWLLGTATYLRSMLGEGSANTLPRKL